MKNFRHIACLVAGAAGVALLTGCVGVPGPGYSDGYYSQYPAPAQVYGNPVYTNPVYVNPPPVYIEGGYGGGPRRWDGDRWGHGPQPGYGRPGYVPPPRPVQPGFAAPRPGVAPPPVRQGALPAPPMRPGPGLVQPPGSHIPTPLVRPDPRLGRQENSNQNGM